jgi:hypothetical protein
MKILIWSLWTSRAGNISEHLNIEFVWYMTEWTKGRRPIRSSEVSKRSSPSAISTVYMEPELIVRHVIHLHHIQPSLRSERSRQYFASLSTLLIFDLS